MNLKHNLKFIAAPSKICMTIVVLLFANFILQITIIEVGHEIANVFRPITPRQKVTETRKEKSEKEKPFDVIRKSQKRFLPDGTVLQVYSPSNRYSYLNKNKTRSVQVYDVNSNLLWEGLSKDNPHQYLTWPTYPKNSINYTRMRGYYMITPELSRSLEVPVRTQDEILQIWRYNLEREYFVGYNTAGGKAGYVGSSGFTESKSQVKPLGSYKLFTAWCPEDSYSPTLLWQTNRKIYQIDFENRQFELLFESLDSDIKRIAWHKWGLDADETLKGTALIYRPVIVCYTENRKVYLIMRNPKQQLTVNIPEDWISDFVVLTTTEKDIYLKYDSREGLTNKIFRSPELFMQWGRQRREQPTKRRVALYKVDKQGELNLVNRFDWIEPARKFTQTVRTIRNSKQQLKSYITSVSPPLYDFVWKLFGQSLWQKVRRSDSLISVCLQIIHEVYPSNKILTWTLSVVMICVALWHGWSRRTSWCKMIFWLIFVGIFNLAGFLTYWALNHTAVIKCPACSKRRGLSKVSCIHCGVELPAPERRKVDLIFDS